MHKPSFKFYCPACEKSFLSNEWSVVIPKETNTMEGNKFITPVTECPDCGENSTRASLSFCDFAKEVIPLKDLPEALIRIFETPEKIDRLFDYRIIPKVYPNAGGEDILNGAAEQGWELILVDGDYFYFKRKHKERVI